MSELYNKAGKGLSVNSNEFSVYNIGTGTDRKTGEVIATKLACSYHGTLTNALKNLARRVAAEEATTLKEYIDIFGGKVDELILATKGL
jgi:hypothetical protein